MRTPTDDPAHEEFLRHCDEFPESIRKLAMGEPMVYAMIRQYARGTFGTYREAVNVMLNFMMEQAAEDRKLIINLWQMQEDRKLMINLWQMQEDRKLIINLYPSTPYPQSPPPAPDSKNDPLPPSEQPSTNHPPSEP